MNKTKTINTPIGKIQVGPGATPSKNATVTIREMKGKFIRVAKSGIVPVEDLRYDTNLGCSL